MLLVGLKKHLHFLLIHLWSIFFKQKIMMATQKMTFENIFIDAVTPKKSWIRPSKLIEKVYFDGCSGNEIRMKT